MKEPERQGHFPVPAEGARPQSRAGAGRRLRMEGGRPQPGYEEYLAGCLKIPPLIIFINIFIFYFWTDSLRDLERLSTSRCTSWTSLLSPLPTLIEWVLWL